MSMKEAYEKKMEAQVKEWSAKIDVLKAKAEKVSADQKVRYHEQLESLKGKQRKLEEKLDKLRSSSESAWEEIKGGVEHAWEDLKNSVEKAGKKLK